MTDARLPHDWFPRPLPPHVTLGDRSWLHSSFAFLHDYSRRGIRIGRDTGIYKGTFFDLGPEAAVEIGDYCTLVSAVICSNSRVTIADYVFIAHEVVLADGAYAVPAVASLPGALAPEAVGSKPARATGDIIIHRNAWIGARAIILGGSEIGENAIIGAACLVSGIVPDNAIMAGNPARIVGSAARR